MQDAGTVLAVLRERGRRGLPCDELYRQMFNKDLYRKMAYGNIYANQGAMTPGARAPRSHSSVSQAFFRVLLAEVSAGCEGAGGVSSG